MHLQDPRNRPITTVEERVKVKPHINYCINITDPHSHGLRENKTKEEIRIMLKFMNNSSTEVIFIKMAKYIVYR